MTDRYIIVCRDGYVSYPFPKLVADRLLASWLKTHHGKTRPAYRIRIREKARHLTRDEHEMLNRALCAGGNLQYEFG